MAFMMTISLKRSPIFFVILFMILDLAACASNPLFPPKVTDGIDEHFDFEVWRKTPNTGIGRKIELAGRVVRSDMRNGETFAIVEQLPIVDGLVYETLALKKRTGEYGVFYRATIDPKWLGAGNLLMVIGTVTQPKAVDSQRRATNPPVSYRGMSPSMEDRRQGTPPVPTECRRQARVV